MDHASLFEKYDIPVPRYTSYPPVPNWKGGLTTDLWIEHLNKAMAKETVSWSLYLHLPFCESLCTYCGCNTVITKDHSKEDRYMKAIHKEWEIYLENVPGLRERPIRQIHLGGGTPTFFNAEQLKRLMSPILSQLKINPEEFEGAVEVDPRRVTEEQFQALREMGFNRISLGVQDFDPDVQKYVNRIQPFEMVEASTNISRELGYKSLNFDLIYGLPGQTEETILDTAKKTVTLRPDRIAFYSLAVVPWLKPAHNKFKKLEVRKGYPKRKLFEVASEVFVNEGYVPLGFDHFALPEDPLAIAFKNKSMHRNFMGYAEYSTDVLIGLGMSAISESPESFHQNMKVLDPYYEALELNHQIPSAKGHLQSEEDLKIKKHILDLMTNYETPFPESYVKPEDFSEFLEEGLAQVSDGKLIVTEKGLPFVRHICHRLDRYAQATKPVNMFSSGV